MNTKYFVIGCKYQQFSPTIDYYIGDGVYKYGGEKYAVTETIIDKAKRYSSKARAQNALAKLEMSCVNIDFPEILDIRE